MTKYPYNSYKEEVDFPLDNQNNTLINQTYTFEDIDDYIFCEDEKAYSER